jgi:molybdopterin converting factor subunit 1
MRVKVRLFASLREAVGRGELPLELPQPATPDDAWRALVALQPTLAERRTSLAVAVNRAYATFDHPLSPGDEVAFIPPVSGGSTGA